LPGRQRMVEVDDGASDGSAIGKDDARHLGRALYVGPLARRTGIELHFQDVSRPLFRREVKMCSDPDSRAVDSKSCSVSRTKHTSSV
jgi:hypothetical protein